MECGFVFLFVLGKRFETGKLSWKNMSGDRLIQMTAPLKFFEQSLYLLFGEIWIVNMLCDEMEACKRKMLK